MAASGSRQLDVICPGFSVDCVETLEEIAISGQEIFAAAGGAKLNYISALNDSDDHVRFVVEFLLDQFSDWLPWAQEQEADDGHLRARQDRAVALGAAQ